MMPLSQAEYEKELAIMKKDQKQGKDFMCMRLSELCNAWDVPQKHKHNGGDTHIAPYIETYVSIS